MKVTWNWLSELIELEQPLDKIVDRLTMSGLEIESIDKLGADILGVTCAQVIATRPHPNADRLTVCDVQTGSDVATVVCGASNVRVGMRTAYARPGTTLPGGRQISATEIRGTASAGMLCSEAELGLGADGDGILDLAGDAPLGARVASILGFEDTVIDVAITPNRGDCLSVLGIAREIAALTGQRLRRQRIRVKGGSSSPAQPVTIHIANPDLCGRYVARVLEDIQVGPSPRWMQYRLQAVGVRAINNVVDITNYVMVERGQPLHAFDLDRLPGSDIVVRRAGEDRRFTTLDGQERELEEGDLVIAIGGRIAALAGIMGGADSGVTDSTRRVVLESACFLASAIRRTSKRLGLKSESSYRFERGTDIEAAALASDRAAELLAAHAGARLVTAKIESFPAQRPGTTISLRLARTNDLLGMDLGRSEVSEALKALGMSVSPATRGTLNVSVPTYRTDITREIDVIEEIVRVAGYDSVPTTLPACGLSGAGESLERRRIRQLREALAAFGLTEAVPLSFCSQRLNQLFPAFDEPRLPVAILNPISNDDAEMRLSLCSGLIRAARHNADQALSPLALFALGKVFWKHQGYCEARRVAGVVARSLPKRGIGAQDSVAEFPDIKGIVENILDLIAAPPVQWERCTDQPSFHPGKSARIQIGGHTVGVLGALHPAVADELGFGEPCWLFELDLEKLLQYGRAPVIFRELQRFPAVVRDVAVLVDRSFASSKVIEHVHHWQHSHPLLEDIVLFDQYDGPPIPAGKKSLAYSISYRAADRTLTDTEINTLHDELKQGLLSALPVELR